MQKHSLSKKQRQRETSKRYYQKHRKEILAKKKKYSKEHREERYKYERDYWKEHPEQRRKNEKRYRAKSKDKISEKSHRARIVKAHNGEYSGKFHTKEEWEKLKKDYNYRCVCCGKQEPEIELFRDHVIPLFLKGTDEIGNIQPLCRMCNARKGIKCIDFRKDGIWLHDKW